MPKQVGDKSSAAWNKGRIFYSNADDEVVMAYSNQYAEDMDRFFRARAAEVVCGGLMVIIVPSRPNGVSHSEFPTNVILEILGSCFMDMAKKVLFCLCGNSEVTKCTCYFLLDAGRYMG